MLVLKRYFTVVDDSCYASLGETVLIRPGKGVKYCDQRVCMSVRSHISTTTHPNFTKFSTHVTCGHGSVLL